MRENLSSPRDPAFHSLLKPVRHRLPISGDIRQWGPGRGCTPISVHSLLYNPCPSQPQRTNTAYRRTTQDIYYGPHHVLEKSASAEHLLCPVMIPFY
ncbi:hypothetical protein MHYP_G00333280 [Metynnis hypsauchen]